MLAQRTIDRPTPKAPKSTSSREIETLRDARGRELPATHFGASLRPRRAPRDALGNGSVLVEAALGADAAAAIRRAVTHGAGVSSSAADVHFTSWCRGLTTLGDAFGAAASFAIGPATVARDAAPSSTRVEAPRLSGARR